MARGTHARFVRCCTRMSEQKNRYLLFFLVHRCCDIKMPANDPLELVPMPYPAPFPLITATIESMTAALHSSSLLAELSNDAPASFRRFAIDAVFGGPASRAGRDLLTFLGSIVFLQLNAPKTVSIANLQNKAGASLESSASRLEE
jgi:hypothetical protein